ncbi:MAG: A/G-specific adenine glycosylase [Xanthomonadales bacterium]|nr:A/G-specific adenine glycosylase [Xanthomonadales bacterium]
MKPFPERLLSWAKIHGRHDLPWQLKERRSSEKTDAYPIWIAEIMLQQTQVKTVIPYYLEFMQQLPSLQSLAAASLDEVLALWSGLGYYARARNLHKAAQIALRSSRAFPDSATALLELPGIGRSTANAIASQASNTPLAILDGNAKRVFARHAGIPGWPGKAAIQNKLWQAAENRLTKVNGAAYTQAIMDLGASLCSSSKPDCCNCPVKTDCFAFQEDRVSDFPGRKAMKKNPEQHKQLLINRDSQGRIYLEKRPPTGIWGGLWSLPECTAVKAVNIEQQLSLLTHDFSHFRLHITPLLVSHTQMIVKEAEGSYFTTNDWRKLGLPAPIRQILEQSVKISLPTTRQTENQDEP